MNAKSGAKANTKVVSLENLEIKLGQRVGNWKIIALNYYHPSCNEPFLLLRCRCGKLQPVAKRLVIDSLLACAKKEELLESASPGVQLGSCGCTVTRTGLTLGKAKISEGLQKSKSKRSVGK